MRKVASIISFLLSSHAIIVFGQDAVVGNLQLTLKQSVSDSEKVYALNNLANYYNSNRITHTGDSILNEQLGIADLSGSESLVLKTYFDNSIANIPAWSSIQQFDKTISFIQKGIDYAKKNNRYDFVVAGYTRLASVLRRRGKNDEAVDAAILAFNSMREVQDSLKAIVYIELGNCYSSKGESVRASTNYNSAFDIAIKSKNHSLESDIYRYLGVLYGNLGDNGEAKSYLVKSYNLNRQYKNSEGLIKDYIELTRLESNVAHIQQALSIADSLHLKGYRIRAKEILLAIYTYNQHDPKKSLAYLESDAELKDFYMNGGPENYYYELAVIHLYGNHPDLALQYFKMAEPGLLANYDVARDLYFDIATCYEMMNDKANAIKYYELSYPFYRATKNLESIGQVSTALSNLYQATNNMERALFFSRINTNIKDTLLDQAVAKNKDLSLLSVSREKVQHDEELHQKEIALVKKRNLQYMSITIAICLVFACMFVIGMFPVSRLTIRLLGYFFFISLFEFIVLLLDNNILHTITHGEPLKLWLIKIGLIGILVPVQHFLEHGITKFLESRQLLKARQRFSFKKLWAKKKGQLHRKKSSDELENDTAVL